MAAIVAVGAVAAGFRQAQAPSATTNFIEDERGMSLVQHGFSLANSVKNSPDSLPVFNEADIDRERKDIGTNFVRMLILWSAVETWNPAGSRIRIRPSHAPLPAGR